MTSIYPRKDGTKELQFKLPGQKRKTIHLGRIPQSAADRFLERIDQIVLSIELGESMPADTQRWLAGLPDKLYEKLRKKGLVQAGRYRTINDLIEAWPKSCDWSDQTATITEPFFENLRRFFGGDRRVGDITIEEAAAFRDWMRAEGRDDGGPLALATVSRRVGWARQMFAFAVNQKALAESPFRVVHRSHEVNRERDFSVSREIIAKVLEQTEDLEFKAIIAMSRFAGVRVPSEVVRVEWGHINLPERTIVIIPPKTRRYESQVSRTVPIFPDLVKHLEAWWHAADAGKLAFPNYQVSNSAMRQRFETLCLRAGFAMWRKPFVNMRATCETDWLDEGWPIHKVAKWMGHSPETALKHYVQHDKTAAAKAAAKMQENLSNQGNHHEETHRTDNRTQQAVERHRERKRRKAPRRM